jgi:hypothetical protein
VGKRIPKSAPVFTWVETVTAVGRKAPRATVAVTHSWSVPLAIGTAPLVGVNQGTALVPWSATTTAVGRRVPKATAAATWTEVVTATGIKPVLPVRSGSAVAYHSWAPSGVGKHVSQGATAFSHTWISEAQGVRSAKAFGVVLYQFDVFAGGTSGLTAAIEGYWNGQDVVGMQFGDKAVIDWLLVPS